jgi:hypothetical protein
MVSPGTTIERATADRVLVLSLARTHPPCLKQALLGAVVTRLRARSDGGDRRPVPATDSRSGFSPATRDWRWCACTGRSRTAVTGPWT